MSYGGKLHRTTRAHLHAARLTIADADVDRMLMLQLPYDVAKALREYAREADKRPETIAIEALRAYLGAM